VRLAEWYSLSRREALAKIGDLMIMIDKVPLRT
jgi:hypothetical protein